VGAAPPAAARTHRSRQIHGRYTTNPEYKIGYDLQYLVNWSPVLDLQILVRTVWVVLSRRV